MWYKFQRKIAPYVFILPGVLFYLMVTFIPAIIGVGLSFTNWSIITPKFKWVGLRNYERLLQDELFKTSIINTFRYALWMIPGVIIVSLLLALLLNTKVKGITFFRTIYYLPMVTPIAVASVIWMWIYDRRTGILNYIVRLLGMPPRNWLNTMETALGSIIVMSIWLAVGGNMIIYLAALQGISRNYYEAAEIDGAGYWQKFRFITLPLLRPTTLFIVVTTTMGRSTGFYPDEYYDPRRAAAQYNHHCVLYFPDRLQRLAHGLCCGNVCHTVPYNFGLHVY